MQDALIRKLESYESLSEHDRVVLDALLPKVRQVAARTDLILPGTAPETVHLILNGFACRYKVLPNGRRQIIALLVPGDFCDLNVCILDEMDHSIGTISACQVADIPRYTIDEFTEHYPRITRALWWCGLVDEAVLREWLVNIGRRQAYQRIAHLFCELLLRLKAVGYVSGNSYAFPSTSADIAACVGLAEAHVNRAMRELRDLGLVTVQKHLLTIHDAEQLQAYSDFTPNYLHLDAVRWSNRRRVPWLTRAQSE